MPARHLFILFLCLAAATAGPAAATLRLRVTTTAEQAQDVRLSPTDRSVGRVHLDADMPVDEELIVHLDVHFAAKGEAPRTSSDARLWGLEWPFRRIASAAVGEGGEFSLPRITDAPANTVVRIRLEGRYLYAHDIEYVHGGEHDLARDTPGEAGSTLRIDARLGARLTIQLQLPADATGHERSALIGTTFRLRSRGNLRSRTDLGLNEPRQIFEGLVGDDLSVTFEAVPGASLRYIPTVDRAAHEVTLNPFYVVFRDSFQPTVGASKVVVLRLERGFRLRGRVLDEHGAPFWGAKVEATADGRFFGVFGIDSKARISREDGTFEFNAVQPGLVKLSVTALGSVGQVLRGAELEEAIDDPEAVVLTVREGRVLHGRVLLPDGRPLGDAEVLLATKVKPGMWISPAAWTDADGRFTATGFLANAVEVSIEGWHQQGITGFNRNKSSEEDQRLIGFASVAPSETSEEQPVTIVLAPARVLRGRVIDPAGRPLDDCWLYVGGDHLLRNQNQFETRTSTLGARRFPVDQGTGEFEVVGVSADHVGIFAQLGAGEHPRSTALVTLHHTEFPERLELVLDVLHSIDGVVSAFDGRALPDVEVVATKIGDRSRIPWRRSRSGPDGTFELVDLPDGTYELTVDDRNHVVECPVEVDVDSDHLQANAVAVPVVVGGHVRVMALWPDEIDSTMRGPSLVDGHGEYVRIDREPERGESGGWVLGPLFPGEYTVAVFGATDAPLPDAMAHATLWRQVEIIAGSMAMVTLDSEVELTAVVTGLAIDVNGRPLAGYAVAAKRGERRLASARIDVHGRFTLRLQGTEPVAIELATLNPFQTVAVRRVDLANNDSVAIKLTLATGEIHGFMDSSEVQALGTIVEVVPEGEDAGIRVKGRSVRVYDQRGFRVLHLEPGTYTLVPWRHAPGETTGRIEPAGEPQRITIKAGEKRRGVVLASSPVPR